MCMPVGTRTSTFSELVQGPCVVLAAQAVMAFFNAFSRLAINSHCARVLSAVAVWAAGRSSSESIVRPFVVSACGAIFFVFDPHLLLLFCQGANRLQQ